MVLAGVGEHILNGPFPISYERRLEQKSRRKVRRKVADLRNSLRLVYGFSDQQTNSA